MKGIYYMMRKNIIRMKLFIKLRQNIILFKKKQFLTCKTKPIIYTKKTLTINDSNFDILKSIFTNYYKQIQQSSNSFIYKMQNDKGLTLMKGQDKSLQTNHNKSQLQKQYKKNQSKIVILSKNVERKRSQMKSMSQEISILLEKQAKKVIKDYPIYNPQYTNPKLIQLKQQKDKLYVQTQLIRKKISILKESSSQQIQKELQQKRSILEILSQNIANLQNQKKYTIKQLQENKLIIEEYKMNNSVIDLQKKTEQYQNIKKQCKINEKQIRILTQKQLLINQYYFQLKNKLQKQKPQLNNNSNQTINQNQFLKLIQQINQLYQQRKNIQKNWIFKFKEYQKNKYQIQKNIKDKNNQIRQLQNYILRLNLENKRVASNSFFNNNNSSKIFERTLKQNPQTKPQQKTQQKSPKKMVNKVYLALKQEGHILHIGQWSNESQILSDKDADITMNMQKIKNITFFIKDNQIIGLQSIYLTKNNQQIQGKSLSNLQNITQQKFIVVKMEGLTSIQYGSKQSLYMKYTYEDGSSIQIGSQPDILSKLNLTYYIVKFLQAQYQPQSNNINALKIFLEDRPIQQKIQQQQNIIVDKISTQRSFSNSVLTMQKRVITKGKSLKRIKEQTTIDYRLMIHKNKIS